MSYRELLLDRRWKNKRKQIIKRDLNICQNCNNDFIKKDNELIKNYTFSHLIHTFTNHSLIVFPVIIGKPISIYFDSEINSALSDGELFSIYYQSGLTVSYSSLFGIQKVLPENNEVGKNNSFNYSELVAKVKGQIKLIMDSPEKYVSRKEKENQVLWTYVKGLHVHHRYYQKGKSPWEYPDSALITYCWNCHEKLHSECKVPLIDENGNESGFMSPCSRCHGAGWFPEYKHVQEGICFRCRGAKYEELFN